MIGAQGVQGASHLARPRQPIDQIVTVLSDEISNVTYLDDAPAPTEVIDRALTGDTQYETHDASLGIDALARALQLEDDDLYQVVSLVATHESTAVRPHEWTVLAVTLLERPLIPVAKTRREGAFRVAGLRPRGIHTAHSSSETGARLPYVGPRSRSRRFDGIGATERRR